jgi:hypothetical protein
MNGLSEEDFVLFAGPLAGTERGRLRALLIIHAEGEAEIHRRLADDPWTIQERLQLYRRQRSVLAQGSSTGLVVTDGPAGTPSYIRAACASESETSGRPHPRVAR